MPSKGNQFKKNKSSEAKEDSSGKIGNPFKKLAAFFGNEKFRKISGLLLLLFSAYLLVALTSFLFTWEEDQDKLYASGWDILFNTEITVKNWLGKLGAYLSHLFIHEWFGVASFLFVGIFFLSGFKILFNVTLYPFLKSLKYSFFGLIWISITLGFMFHSNLQFLGGAFGYHMSKWLITLLGSIGTGLMIVFSLMVFMVLNFNISFASFGKIFEKDDTNDDVEKEEEEKSGLIQTLPNDSFIKKSLKTGVNELIGKPISEIFRKSEYDNEENEEEVVDSLAVENDLIQEEMIVPAEQGNTSFEINTATESTQEDFEDITVQTSDLIIGTNVRKEDSDEVLSFEIEQTEQIEELSSDEIDQEKTPLGEYDPKLDLSSYKFPVIDLLEKHGNSTISINKEELEANKDKILETLKNYNIGIAKIKATIGPTVTLYEIIPEAGVRISKIKNLEDDIALSLSALGIRIIAPIPGKGTIGIEVPNQSPEVVSMRSIIASEKFQNSEMELPIAFGKTISNEIFIADLAKMPHLLMAGATGQGKSVGLNAILVSLLYKKHPSQIKFVLVDPKKVELTLFTKIERHFLAKLPNTEEAIITDTKKVINTLNSLCIEMDNRYELLKNAQCRNIKEYNTKFIARKLNPNNGHSFLPYIVLVVDEFADLIMTAGKEVETPIARLAQLARAIGIHLIIATQRPSVNIITGTIKANFPARIAFRVTSKIDSRTILDSGGAEQLIGRGDMLLSTGNDLIRLQCAFVDTPEVEQITDFIGSQRGYPEAFQLPEYIDETELGGKEFDSSDKDSMFEEAARIIVQHQQGSASLLQRRLKLGYNRAGRIIDQLEAAGIIGPFEGSKARQVLITDEASLEQILNRL